jgi:SAM-dependent methyltransferase
VSDLYRQLVEDYHLLFPAREKQLNFLKETAGPPPARVLDCACGTGEYLAALAQAQYAVQGIELDEAMYQRALARHPALAGSFIAGDMLQAERLATGPFSLVYCIGNSLAHLEGIAEVASAIKAMWELARPDGKVAIQVANFEHALGHGYQKRIESESRLSGYDSPPGFVYDMPVLSATRDDGGPIQLERHYVLRRSADMSDAKHLPDKLVFHTVLRTAEGQQEAFTPLLILTAERLRYCLPREADRQWFGGFDKRPWSEDESATVVVLR